MKFPNLKHPKLSVITNTLDIDFNDANFPIPPHPGPRLKYTEKSLGLYSMRLAEWLNPEITLVCFLSVLLSGSHTLVVEVLLYYCKYRKPIHNETQYTFISCFIKNVVHFIRTNAMSYKHVKRIMIMLCFFRDNKTIPHTIITLPTSFSQSPRSIDVTWRHTMSQRFTQRQKVVTEIHWKCLSSSI